MRSTRKISVAVLLTGIVVLMTSWGFLVHRTAHQLAVYELPKEMTPFFYQQMEYLVNNAPRPDQRRNSDSTEATKHFIDLEIFGTDAANKMPEDWPSAVKKYTIDTLHKYGYLPYHIVYMQTKLTEAFRKGNKDSILFYAADLGHYIGDAHVPLHTSVNYDGQLTNQKGLHSLWESMVPELELSTYNLYSPHKAVYVKNTTAAVWAAIRHTAKLVPDVFAKETEVSKLFTPEQKYRVQVRNGRESRSYTTEFAKAYAAALKPTINEQLIHSADLIADFWYTAWVDAGKPDLSSLATPWSSTLQSKYENELKIYTDNKLLENNMLLSKKGGSRE